MRYIPIDDEQAELIDTITKIGQVPELLELLKLIQIQQVPIENLIEGIKSKRPFEWEPRVQNVEEKIALIYESALDHGKWKMDNCTYRNDEQCYFNMWTYNDNPPKALKIKRVDEKLRVVISQPEYCAFCPVFDNKTDSREGKLSLITNFASVKRDSCIHFNKTKCTMWSWAKQPTGVYKTIEDGKVWRPLVKDQPQYCVSCYVFQKKDSEGK